MTDNAAIQDVSDTALWVATYRLEESERPDSLFKDPLTALLVGDRGRKIAKKMAFSKIMAWVMVVRTVAIDRLIHNALKQGVDTIVNLGAGLDTRPYRMALPASLRWIEVDFPHMIAMKNDKLHAEKPVCRLERVPIDLTDRALRKEFFTKVANESKKILVITEGVIPYLTNADVEALADDLHAVSNFQFWIQDFHNGATRRMPRNWAKKMKAAPFQFKVPDWMEFFAAHGWKPAEVIKSFEEAKRINRPFPLKLHWKIMMMFVSKDKLETYAGRSGYVLMQRH